MYKGRNPCGVDTQAVRMTSASSRMARSFEDTIVESWNFVLCKASRAGDVLCSGIS